MKIEDFGLDDSNSVLALFMKELISEFPGQAYCCRGKAYLAVEEYDKAVEDFSKAIKELGAHGYDDIEHNYVYRERAFAYERMGNYEAAISDFTRAIESDGVVRDSDFTGRASVYSMTEQYDRAIADCDRAIKLDDAEAYTYALRGEAHNELGNYAEAIADCTKAIELAPDDPYDAYITRAHAYLSVGYISQALRDLSDDLTHGGDDGLQLKVNRVARTLQLMTEQNDGEPTE